jgi:hypothetical protein
LMPSDPTYPKKPPAKEEEENLNKWIYLVLAIL